MYMMTHKNADRNKVMESIHNFTEMNLKNIPCGMHNNVTHEKIETTMLDVFDWTETRSPIISGNGTFFKQHDEYLSPVTKMLEKLQDDRGKKKAIMKSYPKKSIEYSNADVSQLSIKVIMNADYGGSGTTSSPFYSPYIPPATTGTAKNITTSLICCLEFLSGNNDPWAKMNNINELYDMIFIVLNDNESDRNLISDYYTVDEVLSWLISRTNNLREYDIMRLRSFLETLGKGELCKIMLAFNIRKVLTKYLSTEISEITGYLLNHQIDADNITKENIHECGYGVKPPDEIAHTIEYVSKVILDNCVYPFILNDAEIRAENMRRIIVCVTDTDSLMVHFASYLDEFQAHASTFKKSCIVASAFGMRLFIEHIIPKMVNYIALGCNIHDEYYRSKFIFKNEFAFMAMALIAKKMYASSMFVQEGVPRDPHDIAVTGLSFKKRDSPEFLEPIMLRLYDKYILTSENVNISGVLDEFYALRNKLMTEIDHDLSYYTVSSIKDIGAYDPKKVLPVQMRGAIIWNNIVPDEELLPMDRVIVVPLSFKLLREHVNDDPRIAEILRLASVDNPKDKYVPYICLPEHYHEMPEWIKPVVDIEYATDKQLMSFKQLFDAFDLYVADTKAGMIPSRMVFL